MSMLTHNYQGKSLTTAELAISGNINLSTLKSRIQRNPQADATELLEKRKSHGHRVGKQYHHNGISDTINGWADRTGMSRGTFRYRVINYGIAMAVTRGAPRTSGDKMWKAKKDPKIFNMGEPFDPQLEIKRRVKAYRQKGWSDEDILIKEKIAI